MCIVCSLPTRSCLPADIEGFVCIPESHFLGRGQNKEEKINSPEQHSRISKKLVESFTASQRNASFV